VSTTGSDSSTTPTNIATPFLTILHAWNYVCSVYDIGGNIVTIQLADGTYTDNILIGGSTATTNAVPVGGGTINIQGNTGALLNVTWNGGSAACFSNAVPITSIIQFSYVLMENSASSGASVLSTGAYANLALLSVSWGTTGSSFVQLSAPSNISLKNGNFVFTGATTTSSPFFAQTTGSIINFNAASTTATATGAVSWPTSGQGFAYASAGANIYNYGGITFTTSGGGSYTGQRYLADTGGVINAFGGGSTVWPGTVPGVPVAGVLGTSAGWYTG
jgi:hypothetical protein